MDIIQIFWISVLILISPAIMALFRKLHRIVDDVLENWSFQQTDSDANVGILDLEKVSKEVR